MIEYENLKKFNEPFFEEYLNSARDTFESGWYILGDKVKTFEKEFSDYLKIQNCIGVASGLDALIISLRAFEFPEGSEVIVPSNTYIATIISVLHNNLKPVLVEPRIDTYNIDPESIRRKITKKTKAIIPVHLYGKPCEMEEIIKISKEYDLKIIEDCAQSHGAQINTKKTGTFGHCNAFSFYPTKNLGAIGDGGAITTDDSELAEKIRYYRNYGSKIKYHNEVMGFNSRLDEIQAGFLSIKLKYLDKINSHKRKLAQIYDNNLNSKFKKPIRIDNFYDVFHIYPILHKERDSLREYLKSNNINTEIHYPVPPHKQKLLLNNKKYDYLKNSQYPISEEIHNQELSLPISFFHTEDDILSVIKVLDSY
jgi:dTDP-4-amino-4,6-dideoxygalactose transaminase